MTVVSIFRIHLGGVTLTGEVYKPARRCSVNSGVNLSRSYEVRQTCVGAIWEV